MDQPTHPVHTEWCTMSDPHAPGRECSGDVESLFEGLDLTLAQSPRGVVIYLDIPATPVAVDIDDALVLAETLRRLAATGGAA